MPFSTKTMEIPASLRAIQADGLSSTRQSSRPRSRWQHLVSRALLQLVAITLPVALLASGAHAGILLQKGDTNPDVRTLQRALNDRGFKVEEDGIFGQSTKDAVIRFQEGQRNLHVDGVVGEDTRKALGLDELLNVSYGLPCDTFDAISSSREAFGGRYRVIVPTKDAQALGQIRRYCPSAYAVATPLGSYVSVGSFSDRSNAENRRRFLRERGFRDAHVRYF